MKVRCPNHDDNTPSLHLHERYSHCYVCGYHVRNDKIGVKAADTKKSITDVKTKMEYIQNLPRKRIRGLDFPYDSKGFYISWPDGSYYKRRNYTGNARYTGPKGVKPPLFIYPGSKDHIVVVEGEINCMTLHEYIQPKYTLASPGAASELRRHINEYTRYKRITIVVDYDPAGIAFGHEIKELLLKQGKRANLICINEDFNDVLVNRGVEDLVSNLSGVLK